MQQTRFSQLLKLVFKAGKRWVPFLLSIFLVAQTVSLSVTCARTSFSTRSRVNSPVWLDQKYYKNSVPSGFCLLAHSVYPCRVYDIEWNVDVVYWSKFARQGPPVATGDGQPSNPMNRKSCTLCTLSFATTLMTSDIEFSQGGCYIHKENVRNVTAHTLYRDYYFVTDVSEANGWGYRCLLTWQVSWLCSVTLQWLFSCARREFYRQVLGSGNTALPSCPCWTDCRRMMLFLKNHPRPLILKVEVPSLPECWFAADCCHVDLVSPLAEEGHEVFTLTG